MGIVAIHCRSISMQWSCPTTGRRVLASTKVLIAALAVIFRPTVFTTALLAAGLTCAAPSHADPVGDPGTNVLNSIGIGNNGPISSALAQVGQSICPLLVQPASSFASNATQMSGNGGLAPPIAGFLAGQAIQAACPGFMTAIANGTMPYPLNGAATPPMPFGLPGASPPPVPLQLPGMTPPAPSPLQLPAL
jgi:Protein of unknown function (DUF732)